MKYRVKNHKTQLAIIGSVLFVLALACQSVAPNTLPLSTESAVLVVETPPQVSESISLPTLPQNEIDEEETLVNLYAKVNPAVVNITVYDTQDGLLLPLGQGSGFVIDQDGHIVTNAHVIHGAEQVEVTFSDATTRIAEILGEDLNSDLAVVKIDDLPDHVQPLEFGAMDSLAVGQTVVAIGNPFGLDGTLTRGVISALGRNIPALTPFSIPQSIQTDAAINPGNSGGPLLNLRGEVIGVNAQIETGGTTRSNLGVGFAVPISILRIVVPDLISNGAHDWAWLGVRGGSLNPILVKAMNLPMDKGAYMSEILENGPAIKAGLQGATETVTVDGRRVDIGGDVITAVDGQTIRSFDDLLIYIALNTAPGKEVNLSILRDGQPLEIVLRLESRPETLESPTLP